MAESPFQYVGKTLMNLLLVFGQDQNFQILMDEMNLQLDLELLLQPIVDPDEAKKEYIVYVYKKLSEILELDPVNEIGFKSDFTSLLWRDENEISGPPCGNCQLKTTPILYGMPGDDFNYDRFISGGCIVEESNPIWECRNCGWAI